MAKKPLQSRLLVPFGTKDWSVERVSISTDQAGELVFECPVSHVILDFNKATALRLNSDWYRLYERPSDIALQTAENRYSFIMEHMSIYCDIWDKFQQIFLSKYFKFICQHIENNKLNLKNKLMGMRSLYSYQDWLMSAYLPLPQSIIYLPDDPRDLSYSEADIVRVPLLFWTGHKAIVLFFVGSDTPSPRLVNISAKLREGGYTVFDIAQKELAVENSAWLQEFFQTHFGNFWEDETLPSGPFKPEIADPQI